ncbi:lanthionine synthetase LanC family protein [Arcicella sp. DC2W]|uniref:Lanthionine synthetase LanC family protein n=1 Tax=Arcicella gelida TaxID=2984195 RepID=A0ABU5S367_9BACT|nr:lanthionine synthetase LanC family protein [Arcicella sp. DC2W]MEA5402907.1 lanthionine synthetase LanC family protein [Arcicella sp. DC2W]
MESNQKYWEVINQTLPIYIEENKSKINDTNTQNYIDITDDILLLLAIHKKYRNVEIQLKSLCEKLQRIEAEIPHTYCLFTGRGRVIYTYLKVYEALLDKQYLNYANTFISKSKVIDYVTNSQRSNCLLKGRIGVLLILHYLNKFSPELVLEDIINSTFDIVIQNLIVDKFGITSFYPDSNKSSLTGLGSGNAGLIWVFNLLSSKKYLTSEEKIIKSLLASLEGQWNKKRLCWNDNLLKISTTKEHFNLIEHFNSDDIYFFKQPQVNTNFWEGSLGICISLANYILSSDVQNQELVHKIELCLTKIESKESDTYNINNIKELCYLYCKLYKITGNVKYELKIISLLDTTGLTIPLKLSLLLCLTNDYDVDILDVLPNINLTDCLPENLEHRIQKSLVMRYYPQTMFILEYLERNYFDSSLMQNSIFYNQAFFQTFENILKNCSFFKTHQNRKVLKNSLKFEQFNRKCIAKHTNKIFLKIEEIVQFSLANHILNLKESDLLAKQFMIADNVYLFESKWEWWKMDRKPLSESLLIPPSNYYGAIKVKPNHEQKTVLGLSENQLIFLESFYERTSIKDAKETFLNNFEIQTEIEQNKLLTFMDETLEQFIFNGLIQLEK